MFYYASKIGWAFAAPSNFLILLITIGVMLAFTRWARAGRVIALAAATTLMVIGLSPVSALVIDPLEARFPIDRAAQNAPDGVIVLGGGVDAHISAARVYPLELNEAGDRILALIALARKFPQTRLIFSGGAGSLLAEDGVEADEVRAKIAAFGVDPARITFENRSRTTYENAIFTRDIVRPSAGQRWMLVTSAAHMPRAVGCFRQAGFRVDAYPVDYRSPGAGRSSSSIDIAYGLRRFDAAAREWAGLFAYWLTGRTDALFPAP